MPDRGSLPDQHVCADCGATEDLYFHDGEGAWVCEEVADCRETQWDADRAERDRLRAENERLRHALDNVQAWAQEQHDYCWPERLKGETPERVNELRGPCATYGAVVYELVVDCVKRQRAQSALTADEEGASDV